MHGNNDRQRREFDSLVANRQAAPGKEQEQQGIKGVAIEADEAADPEDYDHIESHGPVRKKEECTAEIMLRPRGRNLGYYLSRISAATSALPPVRRAVPFRHGNAFSGRQRFVSGFPGLDVHLYSSGTCALAVALLDARLRHGGTHPEAIIPAYGCPQLVAACMFAGVRPRLVDTAREHWGYDLKEFQSSLSRDTVAVVAVNLLGVGDQSQVMRPLADAAGLLLIQDSAQYLPTEATDWSGDYVVLSFGRGKPLNLLRGGALATRYATLPNLPPDPATPLERLSESRLAGLAKAAGFNVLTHPRVYWLSARLPGIGDTNFVPLNRAAALPFGAWGHVGAAFDDYAREGWQFIWKDVLPEWQSAGIQILTCPGDVPNLGTRRLRLALLAQTREQRDRLVSSINIDHLGASVMYGVPLNRIHGVPPQVATQGPFPNAELLAGRLFTLPTHSQVTSGVHDRVRNCVTHVTALN